MMLSHRFTARLLPCLCLSGLMPAPISAAPAHGHRATLVTVLARARVAQKAGHFAEAATLLRERSAAPLPPAARTALRHALADTEFAWAQDLRARSRPQPALAHYEAAYALDKGGRLKQSADDLRRLGLAFLALSQYDQALESDQRARAIATKIGDAKGEEHDLSNIGWVYGGLGQYNKALALEQQALIQASRIGDTTGQGKTLCDIGGIYDDASQFDKALNFVQKSLPLARKEGDKDTEARALSCIGSIYDHLGQFARSLVFAQQALAQYRKLRDERGSEYELCCIGIVYRKLHRYDMALYYENRSLSSARKIGDLRGQEDDLANIGIVYEQLKRNDKALDYVRQALSLDRKIGDVRGEDEDLGNLGSIYERLGRDDLAVDQYSRALMLERQIGDVLWEGDTFENLMLIARKIKRPELAVYYGKQSVNAYQTIRAGVAHLDMAAQKSYLATVEKAYRQLADLLISQGRLPEAEQVLRMLKDQELTDFVQRDASDIPAEIAISFDPDEQAALVAYQKYADPVTKLGHQLEALQNKKGRTEAENREIIALQNQLTPAQQKFQTFLTAELPHEMAGRKPAPGGNDPTQAILDAQKQQTQLRAMGTGVVALYTVVEPNQYRIIVVTAKTETAEEYPIKAEELRRLVFDWRNALRNPNIDPRPLGQKLSRILIGPIERDLSGAQAQTLLWSLDDVLRLVPLAALYDGRYYLAEKYRTAVFTGASLPAVPAQPVGWQGGGGALLPLGVTQAHTVKDPASGQSLSFPSLPGVDQELKGITLYDGNPGGVLAGKMLEDGQFTQAALRLGLAGGCPVVHIASHFELGGDYKSSFLLLGDGTLLTLDVLCGQGGQIFQGVDMLTLSACQTGEGGSGGDGHQVESLAALAQEQGASSILASLWPVSDATTPLLMREFYRRRVGVPDMSKAEALRQAQLTLLHGTASVPSSPSRGTAPANFPESAETPPFSPPKDAPYAHPYFWAPFVLTGNWR